ncbi:MAG: metal-dependent transcriptional regulator [Bacteroidetes bacterium]|nr:metal-dependent transcriptional regulator [Bacteroidota bacterium]
MTIAEENYLKAIFKLSDGALGNISTNSIAMEMSTSAASVTDMLKRLADKDMVDYERYKGASLTNNGLDMAKRLVRKHRLWEVFLTEKLGFAWDEIHEIAEELEHIGSNALTERLDRYLGYPRFDPHGDPIPDAAGAIVHRSCEQLSMVKPGQSGQVVGVGNSNSSFLQFLNKLSIGIGSHIRVDDCFEFDGSLKVTVNHGAQHTLSDRAAANLFISLNA